MNYEEMEKTLSAWLVEIEKGINDEKSMYDQVMDDLIKARKERASEKSLEDVDSYEDVLKVKKLAVAAEAKYKRKENLRDEFERMQEFYSKNRDILDFYAAANYSKPSKVLSSVINSDGMKMMAKQSFDNMTLLFKQCESIYNYFKHGMSIDTSAIASAQTAAAQLAPDVQTSETPKPLNIDAKGATEGTATQEGETPNLLDTGALGPAEGATTKEGETPNLLDTGALGPAEDLPNQNEATSNPSNTGDEGAAEEDLHNQDGTVVNEFHQNVSLWKKAIGGLKKFLPAIGVGALAVGAIVACAVAGPTILGLVSVAGEIATAAVAGAIIKKK